MAAIDDLRDFNLEDAETTLWIFRKSTTGGLTIRGKWVETTEQLDIELKGIVQNGIDRIEEVLAYGLLAQNNEGSALSIPADETMVDLITAAADAAVPANKITDVRKLQNAPFYAIKLVHDGTAIYAVRRTGSSWKTRKARDWMSVVFADDRLAMDHSAGFEIAKNIDFFLVGDTLLIADKGGFESVLNYKEAHRDDFTALQGEQAFLDIVADIAPLVTFVGENKIQLRRVCAIRQKGHYANPQFMDNLRAHQAALGFAFAFDANGRIVVTDANCREVIQALLDHRLSSLLSNGVYEVDNATSVQV